MHKPADKKPGLSDKQWLMREASKVTSALGGVFLAICGSSCADLTRSEHAIVQIENNLSGRAVGDSATELGLARIVDPNFPEVLANYANQFSDGRPAKSTSIGLKDKSGKYIAAICLNLDISYLKSVSAYLDELTRIKSATTPVDAVRAPCERYLGKGAEFSAKRSQDPARSPAKASSCIEVIEERRVMERRGAAETIASVLGDFRSNIYYYIKKIQEAGRASDQGSSS